MRIHKHVITSLIVVLISAFASSVNAAGATLTVINNSGNRASIEMEYYKLNSNLVDNLQCTDATKANVIVKAGATKTIALLTKDDLAMQQYFGSITICEDKPLKLDITFFQYYTFSNAKETDPALGSLEFSKTVNFRATPDVKLTITGTRGKADKKLQY